MKLERIQTVQRLPIQLEEAWDFFTSPKNLSLITPHWLDYRINLDPPEYLHPGTIISASIRPVPVISTSWISEITHIRPPQFYITEQRFGPFKMWHHEHHFRAIDEGVEIEDIIMYGMHFGMIGSFVHNIYLRKRLHDVFSYRAQALEQRFGSVRKPRQAEPQNLQQIHEIFEGLTPKMQQAQQKASKQSRPNAQQRPQQGQPPQGLPNKPQQQSHPVQQAPQSGQQPVQKKPIRVIPDLSKPELVNPELNSTQPANPPQPVKPQPVKPQPVKPQPPNPRASNPQKKTPAQQNRPAPQNKPAPEKPKGSTPGKPEPKKVTLDDIFYSTDD